MKRGKTLDTFFRKRPRCSKGSEESPRAPPEKEELGTWSRVECPICLKRMGLDELNAHLDKAECSQEATTKVETGERKSKCKLQVKRVNERHWRSISLLEAKEKENCPVDIIEKALPEDLVEELTKLLLVEAKTKWKTAPWTVYNQVGTTNRLSAVYQFDQNVVEDVQELEKYPDSASTQQSAPEVLVKANAYMQSLVNQLLEERRACSSSCPSPFFFSETWTPSYALCNFYRDGSDSIGFHNDSLTKLGPRPLIAALSLGSTRMFRWFKLNEKPQQTFSVQLRHNTVLVMWPPMQEEWKHGVPSQSNESIEPHPVTGLARISLTFRMERRAFSQSAPECYCGKFSSLKYSLKAEKYYFKCSPGGTRTCDFFQWLK